MGERQSGLLPPILPFSHSHSQFTWSLDVTGFFVDTALSIIR
jgi:hypothetical protein